MPLIQIPALNTKSLGEEDLLAKRLGGDKFRIFLGSSTERRAEAEEIEEILRGEGWDVLPWWSPEAFPLGSGTLTSLIAVAPRIDAAMLLFSDEDTSKIRGVRQRTPRDNVLIEYGLFMGMIGGPDNDRVVICRVGHTRTATDLAGITTAIYDPTTPSKFLRVVKPWLKRIQEEAIQASKGLAHVFTDKQKKHLFLDGELLVRGATREIVLCAKTPVPFVGTRPYNGKGDPPAHEVSQLKAYDEAIDSLAASTDKRVTFIGCLSSLKNDLADSNHEPEFRPRVRSRLEQLYRKASLYNERLSILWNDEKNLTTFVTGDDKSIIWYKNSMNENVWFQFDNQDVSATLKHIATSASSEIEFEKLTLYLGLND